MKLYKLNKTVLSVKNNPAQFLNGLTSNALDAPRNAFLNIHGRIIAVFDQIKISEDEFWMAVEDLFVDKLLEHLDRYIKLSRAEVQKLNKHVYFDLSTETSLQPNEAVIIPQGKGRLVISNEKFENTVSEENFTLFRLRNNIPIQGVDYADEFVLNISEQDFVSFKKGCFLGQEPVSKVHNRSSPTWKLVVEYENKHSEEEKNKMTSKARDPDSGHVSGFMFIHNKS